MLYKLMESGKKEYLMTYTTVRTMVINYNSLVYDFFYELHDNKFYI